jgi:hypothetical protein
MQMILEERVEHYVGRGFEHEQAEVLVLMEESVIALFSAFPEHFVLFGGATLVLFHSSPRLSKDLDLLSRGDAMLTPDRLQEALEERVQEVAAILGLAPVKFEPESRSGQFVRLWIVGARQQRLFTVDLTRIGGSVLTREIVQERIVGDKGTALIPTASRDYLLLQKAESFVSRRIVKARDAFDISLLIAEGAALDQMLKAHLNDALMRREINGVQINKRIEQITSKLCRAELEPVLPEEIYAKLEQEEFESFRAAVRALFAEWL